MPPQQARGHARSFTAARGAHIARRAHGNHAKRDDENHQESVMEGGPNAPKGGVGGAPSAVFGGAEFMQGVFIVIEQVVRNIVQIMQVSVRAVDFRTTTAMKVFLQLCSPTFKGETGSVGCGELT